MEFLFETESVGKGTRVGIHLIREPEGTGKRDISLPNKAAIGHSLRLGFVNNSIDIQHSDAGEGPLAEFDGGIQLAEASL